MKCSQILAAVTLVLALALAPGIAAGSGPPKISKDDRCPVCGMFASKYPDFVSTVVFKGGGRAFFDGPKDMFKYYQSPGKYNRGKQVSEVEAIYVTDYYGLRPIDGLKAYYVIGSNVLGPMGKDLVPFEREADANEFMADHAGKSLLRFEQVTPDVIKSLD